jgi:hypothetical protein
MEKKDDYQTPKAIEKQKMNYVSVSKTTKSEDTENETKEQFECDWKFSSINKMVPAYMGWSFKDDNLVSYISLYINLPSGIISSGNSDLFGLVEPSLRDGNKLLQLKCQWPGSLTDEQILVAGIKDTKTGKSPDTMIPLKQKFREQLVMIKKDLKLNAMCNVGTDIEIPLPCEVEGIEEFEPICCARTGGMNVFICMKTKQQQTYEQRFNYKFKIIR